MDSQNPLSPPQFDSGATSSSSFIPNRAYAKIWRSAGVFALVIGTLLGLVPLNALFSEIFARVRWSNAEGQLAAVVEKWADENR